MKPAIYKTVALFCLSLFFAACGPSSAPTIVSSSNTSSQPGNRSNMPAQQNAPQIASSSGTQPEARETSKMPRQPDRPAVTDIQKLGWQLQSGKKQTLKDYKGKVLVLDFWATYCPPCLEEIPHLVDIQAKHATEGL